MKIRYELRWGCKPGDFGAHMYMSSFQSAYDEYTHRLELDKSNPKIIQYKEFQINLVITIAHVNIPIITLVDMNGNVTRGD